MIRPASIKSTSAVREAFIAARQVPVGPERTAYLDQVCGIDLIFRSEIESLLEADAASQTTLKSNLAARIPDHHKALIDTTIDRYHIVEWLGEGGFGEVFRAVQTDPLRREVALKLIKPGMDSREVMTRFEAERQALALMDHPSIAQVYDAGTTEAGRPYFVMELVRGEPITIDCDENRLSVRDRLRIFQQVCEGVQHAHQKGVIHRDLKPSNIVVTRDPDTGRAATKIIDFGIAKSLQVKLTEETLVSRGAIVLGTPAYMSPEQLEPGSENIDTRTDVYALGVLLYELLAGARPFKRDTLDRAAFPEVHRIIREVDPPKPSNRVHTLGQTLDTVARQRVTEPTTLERTLRGDLDWIVMKAIEKDRDRRYQGADDFSRDVTRYLEYQPVAARPPSRSYRVRKFVRRHRLGVAATAAVVVALIAGLTASVVGFRRAVAQQRLTDEARARSQELVGFIMEDLQQQLQAIPQRQPIITSAQAAVRYYDKLPPELRDHATVRAHAKALEVLSDAYVWGWPLPNLDNSPRWSTVIDEGTLWQEVATADPEDGEAAAEALWREFQAATPDSGDWTEETVDCYLNFVDRYRDLERRFPDEVTLQTYLIRLMRSLDLMRLLHSLDPIGYATEAYKRAGRLVADHPDDDQLQVEQAITVDCVARTHYEEGNKEAAWRSYQEALAIADSLLTKNPTHFQYLVLAERLARRMAWHPWSEQRTLQAIAAARGYIQRARNLDPAEPYWAYRDAEMVRISAQLSRWKATVHWRCREIDEATHSIEMALAIFDSLPEEYRDLNWRISATRLAGVIASRSDHMEARARCSQLRTEYTAWAEEPEEASVRSYRRIKLLYSQGHIMIWLRDWPALEPIAREMLAEIEERIPEDPSTDEEHGVSRAALKATAQAFLGTALLRQDRTEEALPMLEQAFARFGRLEKDGFPALHRWRTWETAENLASAMQEERHTKRAVELLEWAFTKHDAYAQDISVLPRESLGWSRRGRPNRYVRTAGSAWLLAQALDPKIPAQAARRREVLDRAAELLDDPEVEPRLWPEEREMRAQIEEMRTF